MSKSIDEKVVEMRFDNKQFEANVKTSMSTIDKLKQSLKFDGASKGFEDLKNAANKVTFDGMTKGIETVQTKFSYLQATIQHQINNIVDSAVNAGKRIASAFTIEPVKTGFQEYELKMGSIQTIMASTGESLETVNKYLEELNTYSDKTIYSFSDMTTNIGKFTNAGVKLEDAVAAIKGVSNEAAVSGANANEASRAMYNFAQALSSGYVKLIDWKSIENANMATVEFKNQLLDTALALGTVVKQGDKYVTTTTDANGKTSDLFDATHNFNEALSAQWMTTEVLTETLKKYADETTDIGKKAYAAAQDVKTFSMMMDTLKEAVQSGWAQTWELVVGDFEEAKKLWTELAELFGGMIDNASKARNELLGDALGSKWSLLAKEIENAGINMDDFNNKLIDVAKKHGVNIDKIIEQEGSLNKALNNGRISKNLIIQTIKAFAESEGDLANSTENLSGKLKDFEGVVKQVINGDFGNGADRVKALTEAGYDYAEIQDLVNRTLKGEVIEYEKLSDAQLKNMGYTDEQIAKFKDLAEQAEKTGTPINELLNSLKKPSGRELLIDSLRNSLKAIVKIFKTVKESWREVFEPTSADDVYGIIEALHSFTEKLILSDDGAKNLKRTLKGVFSVLKIVSNILGGAIKLGFKILGILLGKADSGILDITASIGDMLTKFEQWISKNDIIVKGFEKIASAIPECLQQIKDWVSEVKQLPGVQKAITTLEGTTSKIFGSIEEYFSGGITRITEFIDRLKEMDSIELSDISGILKDFKDNVIDYFLDIDGVFGDVKTAFSSLKDKIKTELDEAGGKIQEFRDKIEDFLGFIGSKISDNIGMGEILTILGGAGLIAFAKKAGDIIGLFEKLASPFAGISDLIDNLSGVLVGLQKKLKAEAFNKQAEGILKIAGAIAVLAGALWIMAQIPPDRLWSVIGALGALAAGVLAMSAAMIGLSKLGGIGGNIGGMLSILGIVKSLSMMIVMLKMMDGFDYTDIEKKLLLLGILATALTGLSAILASSSKPFSSGAGTAIGLALSLMIMVKVLEQMSKLPVEQTQANVLMLGELLLFLGSFMIGISLVGKKSKSAGVGILAISASLLLITEVMKRLGTMDPKVYEKGMQGILTFMTMYLTMITISIFAGKNAKKAGIGLLAMSAGLLLITGVVKILGRMDSRTLGKGIVAIGAIITIFSLIVMATKLAGEHAAKAGVMLMGMSAAMLLLTGSIVILSHIPGEGLARAVAAISAIEILFAGLIAVTKFAGEGDKIKSTILMLAISLGVMAIVLAGLSMIEPDNLKSATTAISIVIGMFAVLVASTKLAEKCAGTIVLMSIAVAALGGVLYLLANNINPKSVIPAALALSTLVLAVSGALFIVSKFASNVKDALFGVLGLTAMAVPLLTFVGVLALMQNVRNAVANAATLCVLATVLTALLVPLMAVGLLITASSGLVMTGVFALFTMAVPLLAFVGVLAAMQYVSNAQTNAEILITLMNTLTQSLVQLSLIGPLAALAAPAIQMMILLMSEMALLMIGIGYLNEHSSDLETFLNSSLPILNLVGQGIGEFASGIVSGFINNLDLSGLSDIGADLSAFMDELTPFIEGAKNIDASVVGGVASLIGAMMLIISGDFVSTLTSFILGDNSMSEFGAQLKEFGKAIVEFSSTVAGKVDGAAVESAANAGAMMAEMASKIPNSGNSLVSWLLGDNTMDEFGQQLVKFGWGISRFSQVVSGKAPGSCKVDEDAVKSAANAGKMMTEMAETIPNSGNSLAKFIFGDNTMDEFGRQLEAFGLSIVNFSSTVAGKVDGAAVESAANAGKMMTAMADTIPNSGLSLSSFILGDNTMSKFGEQLVAFGWSLKSFSSQVAGNIDEAAVEAAANASMMMAAMSETIPNTGGVVSFFTGDNDMVTFGEQLVLFGESMAAYSNEVSGIAAGSIERSVSGAKGIVEVARAIPENGWFDKVVSIDDFGAQMAKFGEKYAAFYKKVKDVGSVSTVISNVKQLVIIGKDLSGFDSEGMKEFSKGLESLAETNIDGLVTAFEGSYGRVSAAVNGVFDTFNTSVNNCKPKTLLMFKDVVDGSVKAIGERGQAFLTSGSSLMMKLNAGFRSRSNTIRSTVASMVSAAYSSISANRSAFVTAGASLVEGFADGITENAFKAESAAAAMAEAAYEAAKEELEINSPSKKFRRMAGCVPEGFAQGIDRLGGMVKKSSVKMANLAIDSTADALGSLTKVVDSNTDFRPTIRPVVDMSNLRTTDLRLGSNMNTMITRPVDSWSQRLLSAQSDINESNNKVITAINGLREDISTLYNSDNKELALYVDSKKLTSALVKPMNRQFNVIATREGGL